MKVVLYTALTLLVTIILFINNLPEDKNFSMANSPLQEDMEESIRLISQYSECIDSMREFTHLKNEILAPVFPELIRWNAFQDLIETQIDENNGSDFSIGLFQMKPSFVEKMEKYVRENALKQCGFILINNPDEKAARAERISRMRQPYWQFRYASVFWHVAEHRFHKLNFKTPEERIQFYAAAYNYGFLSPVDEIFHWQTRKLFPYGPKHHGPQQAYSDISLSFYQSFH